MASILKLGSTGADVARLGASLKRELGGDAAAFPGLEKAQTIDTSFDAAIRRWQAGIGIIADGIVGPCCQSILGLATPKKPNGPSVASVSQLFPATKPANIARYLPYVESALAAYGLTDAPMVLAALGTIRAETEGFVPISEGQSKYNTHPGQPPFGRYDGRLGNTVEGDGFRYRGRGFVQLTGKENYSRYGAAIRLDLVTDFELANAPEVAATLLAAFLSDKKTKMRAALGQRDYAAARKLVNGGAHGLPNFKDVFTRAESPGSFTLLAAGTARGKSKPESTSQRPRTGRSKKDAPDLRDRLYTPPPINLLPQYPTNEMIEQFLAVYSNSGLVLDQGEEGACTGFGLACVINYLRWRREDQPEKLESVSPRMLYMLARRYDEYQGEDYEGSSCRGALKGWFNNGVCEETDWPYTGGASNPPRYGFAERAHRTTVGVYYRIDPKIITDLQAAIQQHGAVFVSCFTHSGWDGINAKKKPRGHDDLPVIAFDGRPSQEGGHAFALVGFNSHGFILQNSWGKRWGAGGFAVLAYRDWLTNAMDAWVVALGVPGVVAGQLASPGLPGSGRAGADRSKWWNPELAYQHSVIFGTDGRIARYLTEDEQPRKLQQQVFVLPDAWFREHQAGRPKRLVLYAHGGLNSEDAAIERARAMGRFFIGNGCYPIFLVWRTGLLEAIGGIISGNAKTEPGLAGAGLSDASDFLIEKTIGRPLAHPIWTQMKQQAGLCYADRRGGDVLLDAIQALARTWGSDFELHVVGHSAGAIFLGNLLTRIATRRKAGSDEGLYDQLSSIHLFAPACTVSFANAHYAVDPAWMKRLHLSVLSDKVERDDSVGMAYRKSLLYLVSNCLEGDLRIPLLGLERIDAVDDAGWDGTSDTTKSLLEWRTAAKDAKLKDRKSIVADEYIQVANGADGPVRIRSAHGGFDNDLNVMTRTLASITGGKLKMPIDDLRGF